MFRHCLKEEGEGSIAVFGNDRHSLSILAMNGQDVQDEDREPENYRRSPVTSLSDFTLDTLIHLQSFMQPVDIMTLRQCCKSLSAATKQRTVWLDALRHVCAAHEVSLLTYPMGKMSLADLEHAATSPARFLLQLSKKREDPSDEDDLVYVPPFSTRLFQPRLPRSSTAQLGEASTMRLVPGGRYLITASNTALVSIWDLGYSPASVFNPYPLVSTSVPQQPTQLLIQPTQDRRGFRLLLFYTVNEWVYFCMLYVLLDANLTRR
ncbi:hypothetical protein B0H10DRAFT_317131 [Mycena sp. CBHHK59/15]|nr:hypothetical protein B0H10DRAFT_317131 [Mycena sp. CBHHK59/15]